MIDNLLGLAIFCAAWVGLLVFCDAICKFMDLYSRMREWRKDNERGT